jgi:hypothetical protein
VRLNSDVAGTIVGTIHGRLPLWFDHDGVTYIRTPHQGPDSEGTSIYDYRAVAPA